MKEYLKILGLKVEDKITGFKGIVTSVSFDVYGCVQCVVSPPVEKNKPMENFWFDFKRLKIVSKAPVLKPMPFDNMSPVPAKNKVRERGPAFKPVQSSRAP